MTDNVEEIVNDIIREIKAIQDHIYVRNILIETQLERPAKRGTAIRVQSVHGIDLTVYDDVNKSGVSVEMNQRDESYDWHISDATYRAVYSRLREKLGIK